MGESDQVERHGIPRPTRTWYFRVEHNGRPHQRGIGGAHGRGESFAALACRATLGGIGGGAGQGESFHVPEDTQPRAEWSKCGCDPLLESGNHCF